MSSETLRLLNAPTASQRLESLRSLMSTKTGKPEALPQYANNHIHTIYSFSPYSPTAAVWAARKAGLFTAGIMDHDSVAGASEFREAGRIAGVGTTCGFELRVSLADTPFAERKINNPDQNGVAYMAFHSIRNEYFTQTQQWLAPLREKRNERNRKMLDNIKNKTGITLNWETDILPLSQYHEGGAVTERHLLFALAEKMQPDADVLERYDLLGKLKSELISDIYIPATDELMHLDDAVRFAREIDAILCYAYLGDVTASPTGDKKAAMFEDAYLDELIAFMKERGVHGVTYMPSRNTDAQLECIMSRCERSSMKQISGEDINSPRQSFICPQLAEPRFSHLVEAAWDLVRREEKEG